MSVATETTDYSHLIGKKVTLVQNTVDGEGKPIAVEIIGKLENANALGVLIKPTGKSAVELVEAKDIENVTPEVETPKKLTVKYIKPIAYGQARSHLLERHAYSLTEVNDMSEEDAFAYHNSIDHVADDLGHVHGEKPAKAADSESDDQA